MNQEPSTYIGDLLAELESPGTFATRLRGPADDLAIEVKDVGPLRFPLKAAQIKKLRGVAKPSPFGLREKTLHDASVRSGWEVARSRVKIDARRWKPALAKYLAKVHADLGFAAGDELEAVFDKLLIYEAGEFFKPHQDSEKDDDMAATLVVLLPSDYSGGAVIVEHKGTQRAFRRVASQSEDLSILAFYADCHHSVEPIKSGARVALTYQLRRVTSRDAGAARTTASDELVAAVREHFEMSRVSRYAGEETSPPERLVFLLDHEYTPRSLSWQRLKNGDRARVAALQDVARQIDGECFLAIAKIHESWESDYEDPRRYRRGGWRHVAEPARTDGDDHPLNYLINSDTSLERWIDAEGRSVEGGSGWVSEAELHFATPTVKIQPFESHYEGYQGNYGNTVERWYHRAAFVMWPRQNDFTIRARISPTWALAELQSLPADQSAERDRLADSVVAHWQQTAAKVEERSFWDGLLEVGGRIGDPDIARGWLSPLGLHRIDDPGRRQLFVDLVNRHGDAWAQGLLTQWTERRRWDAPDWVALVADLCAVLRGAGGRKGSSIARWLAERELARAMDAVRGALPLPVKWTELAHGAAAAMQLSHALASAMAAGAAALVGKTLSEVLAGKPPLAFLLSLLEACMERSPELRAAVVGSQVHRQCVDQLGAIAHAPARADGDWSIDYRWRCTCNDCCLLDTFLASSRIAMDWPLAQGRREHIHRRLDASGMPVVHVTLRKGSPYVLQLRKEAVLFDRDKAYRSRARELFEALSAALPVK